MRKMIYAFNEGDAANKQLLGGKGAGLAKMVQIGMRVPYGFTITTEQCIEFFERGKEWPEGLEEEVMNYMHQLERETGKRFGDPKNPLLVAVRSGAPESMPGMMDTILNLGLNAKTVKGLARKIKDERFALDSYRRFIMMYSTVVFDMSDEDFEKVLKAERTRENVLHDHDLSVESLKRVIKEYKKIVRRADYVFPQDVHEQLRGAITAVFLSWYGDKAVFYRMQEGISDSIATAVNVQSMVFGNMGNTSGTGVLFSRDPSTGENILYIEWLQNAQGEDVVAGVRTPQPGSASDTSNGTSLEEVLPDAYQELLDIRTRLEAEYKDMVDLEFTIENGILFMLQVRPGKRAGAAAIRIAIEQIQEGLITEEEAILRITEENISQMLHSNLSPKDAKPIASGLNASPGAAIGRVVFTADAAVESKSLGEKVVLVRPHTSPDDIHGMSAAEGIVTEFGGRTSHAAVVGRQMGKPCVVGCKDITVNVEEKFFTVGSTTIREGDVVSIDGGTGKIYKGIMPEVLPVMTGQFQQFVELCSDASRMEVWANAEVPEHAATAKGFGASGIGLARTEHMSFGPDRLPIMQKIILYMDNEAKRRHFISQLEPFFLKDFMELFEVFSGQPVTIRLMDPPLHEFIPGDIKLEEMGFSGEELSALKVIRDSLHESNPMMGHRGCRLGITHPDLYEMQVRAIMNAACASVHARPDVMIPLVVGAEEFVLLRSMVDRVACEVMTKYGTVIEYNVGVMIETPRAALMAGAIAKHADFFSFGTNDLTQFTFGISRDDSGKFLPTYLDMKVLSEDPFVSVDEDGVGELLKYAIRQGRKSNSKLKIGICGEHGGDPKSVAFFNSIGLNYVSCSPLRIPIAIHAAAQATVRSMVSAEVQ